MTELDNDVESVFPLSPTQEGMLYHTLHAPGSGVYIGQHIIELEDIDSAILQQAWELITDRHMALRSVYAWEGISRSVQMVMTHIAPEFHEIDRRSEPFDVINFCRDDLKNEFDLSAEVPSRMTLIQTNEQRFVLVWTRHHLMMDGWSAHIVLDEIKQAYVSISENRAWAPGNTVGFSTYIAWLQQQDVAISKAYWRSRLSNITITPGLEPLHMANRGSPGSRRIERQLSQPLTEKLTSTARENNLTLSTLVHGAWAAVLFSVNESLSLLFGSTVSGRPHDLPEHETIVGNFINTIPVTIDASTDIELSAWLRELQQQMLESAKHGHTAKRDILQAADIPAATTLFDSIVVFENFPKPNNSEASLTLKQTHYHEHSHYAFAVLVIPNDTLQLIIIHDTGQIAPEKADQLLNMLSCSLERLGSGLQGSSTHFFDSLRPKTSNLPTPPLTIEPIDVVQHFKDTVYHHGEKPAVSDADRTLSYKEMSNAVHNLAAILCDMGVQPGDPVLINMPRSIEGLIGIWAILVHGANYIPVSSNTPLARLIALYSRINARLLISSVPVTECECVLVLDDLDVSRSTYQTKPIDASTAAYSIFTSGSTGTPKQVTVSHQNLAHSLAARLQYYGETPHNYALLSSFAFDSSVAGIFWTVATGGCLTLFNENTIQDPAALLDVLSRQKITALLTLPSAYRAILDIASAEFRQHFKLAIVAGEACPNDIAKDHLDCFPGASLVNEYGPTEATVWCSAYRVDNISEQSQYQHYLPIGKAIPGVSLHILDQQQRAVPQGAIGELHIAGKTVTQATVAGNLYATGDLVELDTSGDLIFHGRRDEQLKIRGHRVDPNEIEAALANHSDVKNCAVVGMSKTIMADEIDALNTALNKLPAAEALELLAVLEASNE